MRIIPPKRSNCLYDTHLFGQPQIRVYHRKADGKKSARYLLKCGCCEKKMQIWYSDDDLEINGVEGAIEDWRQILLPLLLVEQKGTKLIDRKLIKEADEAIEDLRASNSSKFRASVQKAREDVKAGRVRSVKAVFGTLNLT